jgi:hypothetical protein
VAAVTHDTTKQLAWEARHRPRAGIAGLVSALTLVIYSIAQGALQGLPLPSGLESLQRALEPGPIAELPSLQIPVLEFLQERALEQVLTGVTGLIGYLGMAWAAGFLAVAARARNPQLRKATIYLTIVGGVLLGVRLAVTEIGRVVLVDQLLAGSRTVADVADAGAWLTSFGLALYVIGTTSLGLGVVFTGLNAMRVGLVSRFFGYVGVVAGVLMLLPLMSAITLGVSDVESLPIVAMFWVAGLGVLFLGRWPGGVPPAWSSGQAEPWPDPRAAARARQPVAAPAPAPAGAARRRKRKKKRH